MCFIYPYYSETKNKEVVEEEAPSLSFLFTHDLLDSSRGQRRKRKEKKKTVRNGLESQLPSPIYPSQLALNS